MVEYRFVSNLPDLIQPTEYEGDPDGRLVKIRIRATDEGVEILGDSTRPELIERLLEELGPDAIDQMLCG